MELIDSNALQEDLALIKNWLKKQLANISTGRPRPEMLEDLPVDAYGQKMNIKSLASIGVKDNKFILEPWDKSVGKAIETAIIAANLGLSVDNKGNEIFVNVPILTTETRKIKAKEVSKHLEDTNIRVRQLRRKYVDVLDGNELASEDIVAREKKQLQEVVDNFVKEIEALAAQKEKEITN